MACGYHGFTGARRKSQDAVAMVPRLDVIAHAHPFKSPDGDGCFCGAGVFETAALPRFILLG
jgi:hypothetical protein